MDTLPDTTMQTANGLLWGAAARDWADVQEQTCRAVYVAVLDRVGGAPGMRVLDVGCGAGMFAHLAACRGAVVTGLDAAEPLLAIARERTPQGTFLAGDLEHLPFPARSFDLVTAFNSVQYAQCPGNALAEAKRVARPGAAVVVTTWGNPVGMQAATLLAALKPLLPAPPPGAPGPFALSVGSALSDVATAAGLHAEEVFDVDSPWNYADLPTTLRGLASSGVARRAIRNSSNPGGGRRTHRRACTVCPARWQLSCRRGLSLHDCPRLTEPRLALAHPKGMPFNAPHLPAAGLRFLKALKRNNDRDWFNARKTTYEAEVQMPWLAVLEAVNAGLETFAPDYIKPARKAAMRIYRDTRFSPNKLPYKTHAAAWWSTTTQERTSGGGFYVHAGADGVMVAAGVYQPLPAQLLAIRRHLQMHHAELRALLADKSLRALLPEFDGNSLKRTPKGFLPDDAAADLLLHRQWALSVQLPAQAALQPSFADEVVRRFRAAAPVVALLNAPLLALPRARSSMF